MGHKHGNRDVIRKPTIKVSTTIFHVPNGNIFHSPQELANHLPLYDPPCIIVAYAWDLGKIKKRKVNF